ncbi:hypothetical protein [Hymenobacter metallicola]|uniref:hypothetical protein n=1 Tax=Hymenobacter metallicola TaxID=2563114 RepID=UPI001436B4DE|nr:hypothetical protein [Hymenobacter metallicola]
MNNHRNLAILVDPDKSYPVAYTIKQNGEKVWGPTQLAGRDLTAPQIRELDRKGLL